jgi:hypothetical protein
MNFVERYRNGEHRRVTSELASLGEPNDATRREAEAVAELAMARVAHNCRLIANRLSAMGYSFSVFCDAEDDGGPQPPLVPFTTQDDAAIARLKTRVGALPLTLEYFWKTVGSVAFTGTHPNFPSMLDPLVMFSAEFVADELQHREPEDDGSIHLPLSPDDYHKDNISGGAPYSVALPQTSFDFELLYESRGVDFWNTCARSSSSTEASERSTRTRRRAYRSPNLSKDCNRSDA